MPAVLYSHVARPARLILVAPRLLYINLSLLFCLPLLEAALWRMTFVPTLVICAAFHVWAWWFTEREPHADEIVLEKFRRTFPTIRVRGLPPIRTTNTWPTSDNVYLN